MPESHVTRELVASETQKIMTALRDNSRAGRSNKLADVKGAFESVVTLEFDTYFFFLRKYHYIAMDREACLQLTPEGERLLEGERRDRFLDAISEYFANRLEASEELLPDSHMLIEQVLPTSPPGPASQAGADLDAPRTSPSIQLPNLPPPPPAASHGRAATVERPRRFPPRPPEEPALTQLAAPNLPPPPPPPAPAPAKEPVSAPVPSAAAPVVSPPAAPANVAVNVAAPRSGAREGAAEPKGQELDLRYVKYDAIGHGPLGTVYRGRHSALGLDVAIKELKDIFGYFSFLQRGEVVKRLKREICAQAVVRHPCIAPVLDQNCDVARPYFVMELCASSLRQRLDAAGGKGLEVDETVRLFLQICYGLRAAHAQGLTHVNLKPENVLIDTWGNVRLADFGLSRVIEVDASKGMPQVFVGTGGMGYMSPEQLARNTKEIGPSSDVYSIGILLYEMLTGQLPGRRSPLPSALNPKIPSKLDPIFDQMTQDRREQRYPDLDAVLTDFYAAFEDGPFLKRGDLILFSDAGQAVEPVRATK